MGLFDVHILAQTVLYFCIFLSGFVISIPLGVTHIYFKGLCILYATWDKGKDGYMQSSPQVNCNFPVYVSVFVCIFYGLGCGIYNGYAVYKSKADPTVGSQMWVIPFLLLNSLITITMFILSCMISVGFSQFCNGLMGKHKSYTSCSDGQNVDWTRIDTNEHFSSGNFFRLLTVSAIAAWIAVFLWICQVGLGVLRFWRNRRQRSKQMNTGQANKDTAKIGDLEPTA